MATNVRLPSVENAQIAEWLRQAAEMLQAQGANSFRVSAYRRAGDTVMTESRGAMAGSRVVRRRELECRAHYERS